MQTSIVGNERALGYDLGSEPLRYAALKEAARSGLAAGTNPITLAQEKGNQKGILIYRPVFGGDDSKCLRGFALAVLRMGTLLQVHQLQDTSQDESVFIDLSLLRRDAAAELLATSAHQAPFRQQHQTPPHLSSPIVRACL